MKKLSLTALMLFVLTALSVDIAAAHHVLGRPAYSLNEDSNTPPAIQAEVRIGDYDVTYMVFPAFPRPEAPGRINLYVTGADGTPFPGKITFTARRDSWLTGLGLGDTSTVLGTQTPDDNIYRQRFEFHDAGDYMIAAEFLVGDEPYTLEFPLRIGEPAPIGPMGIIVGVVIIVLLVVSVAQRRRAMTGKIRGARHD